MASAEVRELARKHPQAFERVAERADGQLGQHLQDVVREESPEQGTAQQPTTAD